VYYYFLTRIRGKLQQPSARTCRVREKGGTGPDRTARPHTFLSHLMGCYRSSLRAGAAGPQPGPHAPPPPHRPSFSLNAQQAAPPDRANGGGGDVPAFAEFTLAELRAATGGFAAENIVSESGEKAPNLVYRGQLKGPGGATIAVKKFAKLAWPDPKQFAVGDGEFSRFRRFGESDSPEA
jgi:hypothetical protein